MPNTLLIASYEIIAKALALRVQMVVARIVKLEKISFFLREVSL
jgi:hypothetical protein